MAPITDDVDTLREIAELLIRTHTQSLMTESWSPKAGVTEEINSHIKISHLSGQLPHPPPPPLEHNLDILDKAALFLSRAGVVFRQTSTREWTCDSKRLTL